MDLERSLETIWWGCKWEDVGGNPTEPECRLSTVAWVGRGEYLDGGGTRRRQGKKRTGGSRGGGGLGSGGIIRGGRGGVGSGGIIGVGFSTANALMSSDPGTGVETGDDNRHRGEERIWN
ncbi:unnamed protein product [Linum trigynum]|uniref:Uncharacterized protein n=1 Tax=Linum trigynum TaxID=586398 RepID=A0AAV2EC91_9ROSI